ncbi:hypothetical protein HDU87_006396 [Geranomyces variabilis]|uniref:Tyrosine specific protein phosphatases domain-containing protein n=1 Tax=Geranomyces variabilis TaxID=109894 RepID=A0AAD5XKE8_9FUNG|nr:hypothetical protein HDU87_006396 [Geranomyces variabilis]
MNSARSVAPSLKAAAATAASASSTPPAPYFSSRVPTSISAASAPATLRWLATACLSIGATLGLAWWARAAWFSSSKPLCPDDAFTDAHSKTHFVRGKLVRVVFVEHRLGRELPLIVFVHGMGAQLQQWNEQILHFSHITNVLAVDVVGHGKSEKVDSTNRVNLPSAYSQEAYTTSSIASDLVALLEIYKFKAESFILVGHSYGCNILAHAYTRLSLLTKAIVFLCPKSAPTPAEKEKLARFSAAPTIFIELLRILDRKGGLNSPSVNRLLAKSASRELRQRQLGWNRANTTRVAQKIFRGADFANAQAYAQIECPVLLIGGEDDRVCPVQQNLEVLHGWLGAGGASSVVAEPFVIKNAAHQVMLEQPEVVNAIIYNWLIECGFAKINLSHQLQVKNPSASKWSLKNYAKWQKVEAVSSFPVPTSAFRPMKTMKQDDPNHTPKIFARRHPEIGLIIDISAEAPPYAPADFSETHIRYLKIPTTSKIPPTREEVARFIAAASDFWRESPDSHIAVHCHYGKNRTGFVVCAYLIERNGCTVAQALAHFQEARPPGIKHIHFKESPRDELYMRYSATVMRSSPKKR